LTQIAPSMDGRISLTDRRSAGRWQMLEHPSKELKTNARSVLRER
jgi:hypothetical protein